MYGYQSQPRRKVVKIMKPYVLNAILNQRSEPAFGQRRMILSDDAIEAIHQRKLLGGFRKDRKCPTCNILIPTSGICEYC